ncbi:MAG: hypothetical protein AB1324_04575 [Candidatus Micrarchaeota archaeon]
MAKEFHPIIVGPMPATFKKLTISVDDRMLGELVKSRQVRLRANCIEHARSFEVLLDNRNPVRGKRTMDSVHIEADLETLVGLVSPTMKVVFEGESYSAEFHAAAVAGRPMFSSVGTLTEGAMKD